MITWIRDEFAIGDADDAREIDNKIFNATLNVAVDLDIKDNFKWRYKVGLVDGQGNHPLTFAAAVLLLESLVLQEKRILVHCQAGTSRSVMVSAAWVNMKGLASLDEALKMIMPLRKVDIYRQELYYTAQMAIPYIKTISYKHYEQKQQNSSTGGKRIGW